MIRDHFLSTIFIYILLGLAGYTGYLLTKERENKNRLFQSFLVQQKQLIHYKTKSGLLATKIDAQSYTLNELKAGIAGSIINEIRKLDIRPRLVNTYAETVITQDKQIVTQLRDSLVQDTVKVKVFDYKDEFYSVHGMAVNDTQKVHIQSTDSLIQVVYKGERIHPLLWIFSRRKLQQVITSKNPNSTIIYAKYIEIKK